MANNTKSWFVGERSEALANILLRSRNDITIRDERSADDGADFLVEVNQGDARWSMLFVVQVKGIMSSDYKEWFESAKQIFKPNENSQLIFPTCLFLINVRDRQACYAWIAEPSVGKSDSVTLHFNTSGDFHDLNELAVTEIVNRVKEWYKVVPRQLLHS